MPIHSVLFEHKTDFTGLLLLLSLLTIFALTCVNIINEYHFFRVFKFIWRCIHVAWYSCRLCNRSWLLKSICKSIKNSCYYIFAIFTILHKI
jgi:hypothetical protein